MHDDNPGHVARDPELRADFAPQPFEAWQAAAVALLGGASYDRLRTVLPEGITLEPIYRAEDVAALPHRGALPGLAPFVRGARAAGYAHRRWTISQELEAETPDELAALCRDALARGQDELGLALDGRLPTLAALDAALQGVDLAQTSIFLRPGALALPATAALCALAARRGVDGAALRGCIGADPLGALLREGRLPCSLEQAFRDLALATRYAREHAPALQTIAIDGQPYRDAGGSAVQELGYTLAHGVEVLRALRLAGHGVDEVAPRLRCCFALGSNFFVEVAKLRAARLLWSRVLEAYGSAAEARTVHLHARTARWNTTAFDPHVNLLRGTTEAFSAIVGGVDSLCVAPFDEPLRPADAFSRRLARNTQLVLGEECDLTHVADPAGGSWYAEWLTDQLARAAWGLFQQVEAQGGLVQALRAGTPQRAVAEVALAQREALARRRTSLIGTNVYPIAGEAPPSQPSARRRRRDPSGVLASDAAHVALDRYRTALEARDVATLELAQAALEAGATWRALSPGGEPLCAEALPARRLAADFEALRQAALAYAARRGHAPTVLQVNLGPARGYRARADWTSGFFQVGGFRVLADRDFADAAEAAGALRACGAELAVLTASDETYVRVLPEAARVLRTALPVDGTLLLAGAPADEAQGESWLAAGIDLFVHVRVNTYELLARLLGQIGAHS